MSKDNQEDAETKQKIYQRGGKQMNSEYNEVKAILDSNYVTENI